MYYCKGSANHRSSYKETPPALMQYSVLLGLLILVYFLIIFLVLLILKIGK